MKKVVLPKANPSTKAMHPLPLLPEDFLPVHFHQQANPLYCAPSVENTSPLIVPIPLSCSCHSISQLSLKKNPSKELPYWLPPPPPLPFSLEPATAKLLLSTLHQSCPCEGHHWPPCCQNQQYILWLLMTQTSSLFDTEEPLCFVLLFLYSASRWSCSLTVLSCLAGHCSSWPCPGEALELSLCSLFLSILTSQMLLFCLISWI